MKKRRWLLLGLCAAAVCGAAAVAMAMRPERGSRRIFFMVEAPYSWLELTAAAAGEMDSNA